MATVERRGKRWRARIMRNGERQSRTFATKAEAVAWARDAKDRPRSGLRLFDVLERYAREVSPTKRGKTWELLRLRAMQTDVIAQERIADLGRADIAGWRDRRLQSVSGATVAREMNLLRSVLERSRKDWGYLHENPMRDVSRPSSPPPRRRRVTADEIDRLMLALGYLGGPPANVSHRVALAFLFALETGMRAGEITGLRWDDVRDDYVILPRTKNGDRREVPLSMRAREIIGLLPKGETVFGVDTKSRDALFRKARDRAEIMDLHFHDSRAEAVWRLSKKLDVLQLASVIGHRDLRSLQMYYAESASEIAARLG